MAKDLNLCLSLKHNKLLAKSDKLKIPSEQPLNNNYSSSNLRAPNINNDIMLNIIYYFIIV